MISWYKQNVKQLNFLLQKLLRYDLQGSFDQDMKPKEIINVLQHMAAEISNLQNEAVEKDNTIGILRMEVESLKKYIDSLPKIENENPS